MASPKRFEGRLRLKNTRPSPCSDIRIQAEGIPRIARTRLGRGRGASCASIGRTQLASCPPSQLSACSPSRLHRTSTPSLACRANVRRSRNVVGVARNLDTDTQTWSAMVLEHVHGTLKANGASRDTDMKRIVHQNLPWSQILHHQRRYSSHCRYSTSRTHLANRRHHIG